MPIRLRLVHPCRHGLPRNITPVYRRGPAYTTNVPGSAGQAIAVRHQTRRKPAAAAWGKCHIFAACAALPAPKAVSPSQVGDAWPPAADASPAVPGLRPLLPGQLPWPRVTARPGLARWIGSGRRPVTAGQVLRKADVPTAGAALWVDWCCPAGGCAVLREPGGDR